MIIAEAHATRCKFLNGIQTTLSTFAGWGEFADVEGSLFDLSATTSRKALLGPSICRAARLVSSRLVLSRASVNYSDVPPHLAEIHLCNA